MKFGFFSFLKLLAKQVNKCHVWLCKLSRSWHLSL